MVLWCCGVQWTNLCAPTHRARCAAALRHLQKRWQRCSTEPVALQLTKRKACECRTPWQRRVWDVCGGRVRKLLAPCSLSLHTLRCTLRCMVLIIHDMCALSTRRVRCGWRRHGVYGTMRWRLRRLPADPSHANPRQGTRQVSSHALVDGSTCISQTRKEKGSGTTRVIVSSPVYLTVRR